MREDAFTVNVFEEYRDHDEYTKTCDEIIAVSKAAETESEVIAALESVNVFLMGGVSATTIYQRNSRQTLAVRHIWKA